MFGSRALVVVVLVATTQFQKCSSAEADIGYKVSENGGNTSVVFSDNRTYSDVRIVLHPPHDVTIPMDDTAVVNVSYVVLCDSVDREYALQVNTSNDRVAWLTEPGYYRISCANTSIWKQYHPSKPKSYLQGSINITLRTNLIGRSWLLFKITSNIEEDNSSGSNMETVNSSVIPDKAGTTEDQQGYYFYRRMIVVVRIQRPIDTAFRVFVYVFVIVNTIGMGCKIDLSVVKEVLKKPVAPIIGFFCQYIFMPTIAFGVAKLIKFDNAAVALGIFACGICPGGGASNIYSYLLGGDLSLSVTMTTISNIAAFGMIPLWMFTLGSQFSDDKLRIEIPFLNIFTTLATVILPLFVGILIKHKSEKIAHIIEKALKPVSLVTIVVLFTFGIYANLYIFKLFKPRTFLAGCLLPYVGYISGGAAGLIFKQPWYRVKTIAIETGVQNTMVAYLMLVMALPPPDGDLAAVGPAASACMTPIPLLVLAIGYTIYLKTTKQERPTSGKDRNGSAVPVENGSGVKSRNGKTNQDKNGSVVEKERDIEEREELVDKTSSL